MTDKFCVDCAKYRFFPFPLVDIEYQHQCATEYGGHDPVTGRISETRIRARNRRESPTDACGPEGKEWIARVKA